MLSRESRLRITVYGSDEPTVETTLGEFLDDNEDDAWWMRVELEPCAVGDSVMIGGGAAPLLEITVLS